jgi:hypothetical protein
MTSITASVDERGDGVGGVAVEGVPRSVVAAGGAGVGVAHGVLHIAQRYAGVERGGAECVAEAVRGGMWPAEGRPASRASRRTLRDIATQPSSFTRWWSSRR